MMMCSARSRHVAKCSFRGVQRGRAVRQRRLASRFASATLHVAGFVPISTIAMPMEDGDNFAPIVELMKSRYELRVRKWRTNMSGCAWRVYHHDGRCVNWIEAPYPKTPISLAIFLHEVGHHAGGFKTYK